MNSKLRISSIFLLFDFCGEIEYKQWLLVFDNNLIKLKPLLRWTYEVIWNHTILEKGNILKRISWKPIVNISLVKFWVKITFHIFYSNPATKKNVHFLKYSIYNFETRKGSHRRHNGPGNTLCQICTTSRY